jgi:hypothetical protein
LIAGETDFTHATQDPDYGAPKSERRMFGHGLTDYESPLYSSSSYNGTSRSSIYHISDINMQPPMRRVYEWEDPRFYTMLLHAWETTSAICMSCPILHEWV